MKPAPRPRINRPPLTASRVAAALAVSTGLRNVELRTIKPIPTRGTAAASAEPMVKQSKAGDVPPQRARTCSPVQSESKPSLSASWAMASMRCQARSAGQSSNSLKKPWGKIRPIFTLPSVRVQRGRAVPLTELVEAVKETREIAHVVEHVRIDAQQCRARVRPHVDRPLT